MQRYFGSFLPKSSLHPRRACGLVVLNGNTSQYRTFHSDTQLSVRDSLTHSSTLQASLSLSQARGLFARICNFRSSERIKDSPASLAVLTRNPSLYFASLRTVTSNPRRSNSKTLYFYHSFFISITTLHFVRTSVSCS